MKTSSDTWVLNGCQSALILYRWVPNEVTYCGWLEWNIFWHGQNNSAISG